MPNDKLGINLYVTEFRDIKDLGNLGRFCDILLLDKSHFSGHTGRAKLYTGDAKTIRLSNGKPNPPPTTPTPAVGVEMTFTILSSPGKPKTDYIVAGAIMSGSGFAAVSKSGQPTAAPANFQITQILDNTITILNTHNLGKAYWELFIAIQDPDGRIGLIDPGVENSEDN